MAHSSRVQGDFSQALMELMVPQLDATATALNHFALNGTLGSAIQNSAARSDDPAILSCLSVRISRPASQLEKGSLPWSDMPGCMHRSAAHASRSPCAEPHMPWVLMQNTRTAKERCRPAWLPVVLFQVHLGARRCDSRSWGHRRSRYINSSSTTHSDLAVSIRSCEHDGQASAHDADLLSHECQRC